MKRSFGRRDAADGDDGDVVLRQAVRVRPPVD